MVKIIEIIGSEPPCPKCRATYKIVEEVVKDLGINVRVEKRSATSREVISKYGIVITPAIAIDGVLKIIGRVPTKKEVLDLLSSN
ncbi:MAG: thioredoxin family protein [Thermoprotei archaeon]|nr:MAG: thioredoxin family protein [Thermoprotei archaeon]